MKRMTVARVRSLSTPGRYVAGPTLYLRVAPGRSKSWVQRLTFDGRRHDIGLGGYPLVTLAEARDQALENRRLVRQGGSPLGDRRRAKVPTFREAAKLAREANRGRWRNPKTAARWDKSLATYAHPVFGDRPVDRIGREDVLRVLTPIWTVKPELGRKVRQRIRATLAWAQAHGHVEHNVAGEAINAALPSTLALKKNLRALPYRDVAAAIQAIADSRASVSAKACLRFVVLTACRSGEARGATWSEIDFDAAEWRIPAARMKVPAEHRVPLADAALAVLETVRPAPRAGRLGVPLAAAAQPTALRHDPDEGAARHRTGRQDGRARLPLNVPHLGGRAHQLPPRRLRACAGASGRVRRRAKLRTVGPVRQAPRAHDGLGGVRNRGHGEGGSAERLTVP